MTHPDRRALIDAKNSDISISRQAQLLSISRSSIYYEPIVNEGDIELCHLIDQIYTNCPFYGSRRIAYELFRKHDLHIDKRRVTRLMREMGIEAIYPRKNKNLSQPDNQSRKYPYLLQNFKIVEPNQVWGTDITYVKLQKIHSYLVAILDWYSRFVVAWQLSDNMSVDFCIANLEQGLKTKIPNIHNSDQGSQFTSSQYTDVLENKHVQISMDGRGRCMDNIFTERLWRTVKYENIYINSYENIGQAKDGLKKYFEFYNYDRPHQGLNNKTPAEIYFSKNR